MDIPLKLVCSLTLLAALAAGPGLAAPSVSFGAEAEAAHSGGCRKNSPPGQCCHAGSKPLHCH